MTNNNKADYYILSVRNRLRHIAKYAPNIFDSISTNNYIMTMKTKQGTKVCTGTKNLFLGDYEKFCTANLIPNDRPKMGYYESPIPLIPKTEWVEAIIAGAPRNKIAIFTIQAEIGTEGIELARTPQKQINPTDGTISIVGCKMHNNGTYKLQPRTAELLRQYLAKHPEEHPFPSSRAMSDSWNDTKKRLAQKLCNPEILKVQFKNLRNYAGAIYYMTMGKDPIATKNFMRHKRLEQTMDYLRGLTEFQARLTRISKLASNPEEAMELINQGFKEEAVFAQGTPQEKHVFSKLNI